MEHRLMEHYNVRKPEFIYLSYTLYIIQMKKESYSMKIAITAQNFCKQSLTTVRDYFTCTYYILRQEISEQLKYLQFSI